MRNGIRISYRRQDISHSPQSDKEGVQRHADGRPCLGKPGQQLRKELAFAKHVGKQDGQPDLHWYTHLHILVLDRRSAL